nr:alcohol dehydrogenase catalytic domain-containing protein [Granulosicoccus sp.]
MKAAVLEHWQHIQVQNVDAPAVGAGEVLVRVKRAGICGSDVHIYNGDNPIATTPVIQGHEFMGVVDTPGEGVTGISPGQRVVIQPLVFCGDCTPCRRGIPHVCENLTVVGVNRNGAFAEYVSVPQDTLFNLPDDLPDNVAVLAEPFSIGFHACQRGSISPTDRVLVIGGGPIGFYTALTARELGVEQIALSEPLEERRNLISAFNLDVVDPLLPSTLTKLQEQTNLEGYDLVVETSGTSQGLDFASQASAVDGRIVTLGFPAKNYADYNITRGIVRELTLIGSRVCTRAQFAQTLDLLTQLHRGAQYDLSR